MALTAFERSLCPCGCGFPRSKSWDADSDGWFEGRSVRCYAKAAEERWRKEHGKDAESGHLLWVVDTRDEQSAAADEPHHDQSDREQAE